MHKDQKEALQRLQDALLEEDLPEQWIPEQTEFDSAYDIYNTDSTDVDMDDYSREVYRGRRRSALPVIVFLISLALLVVMILWCLTVLGVFP